MSERVHRSDPIILPHFPNFLRTDGGGVERRWS